MKLLNKKETFEFDSPFCEPDLTWYADRKYITDRITYENGDIAWFGININWEKERWTMDKIINKLERM